MAYSPSRGIRLVAPIRHRSVGRRQPSMNNPWITKSLGLQDDGGSRRGSRGGSRGDFGEADRAIKTETDSPTPSRQRWSGDGVEAQSVLRTRHKVRFKERVAKFAAGPRYSTLIRESTGVGNRMLLGIATSRVDIPPVHAGMAG